MNCLFYPVGEQSRRYARMNVVSALIEENEEHVADSRFGAVQMPRYSLQGDFGCILDGISVHTGADGWKADGTDAALFGQAEAGVVASGELFRFALLGAAIDRADSVENVLRWKGAGARRDCAAGRTSACFGANLIEFTHDGWSTGAMNCAIDTATAMESGISCVGDRIDADFRYVADQQTELLSAGEIEFHVFIVARCKATR